MISPTATNLTTVTPNTTTSYVPYTGKMGTSQIIEPPQSIRNYVVVLNSLPINRQKELELSP